MCSHSCVVRGHTIRKLIICQLFLQVFSSFIQRFDGGEMLHHKEVNHLSVIYAGEYLAI